MNVIQPKCRMQFTAEDVEFIVATLGGGRDQAEFLVPLLADEASRDLILDDPALYRGILERPACLKISSRLYFYVLVRHTLKTAGIQDRCVADYVAEVLAEFTSTDRHRFLLASQGRSLEYFFELIEALRGADDRTGFCIRTHIGNHSLVLSGLFHERIRHRAASRGFPDISYYVGLGQASFRAASDHRLARRYDLVSIFNILAEHFDSARRALNEVTDRLISLGEPFRSPLPLFGSTQG